MLSESELSDLSLRLTGNDFSTGELKLVTWICLNCSNSLHLVCLVGTHLWKFASNETILLRIVSNNKTEYYQLFFNWLQLHTIFYLKDKIRKLHSKIQYFLIDLNDILIGNLIGNLHKLMASYACYNKFETLKDIKLELVIY